LHGAGGHRGDRAQEQTVNMEQGYCMELEDTAGDKEGIIEEI